VAEREVIESERNGLQEFDSENEEEMVVQEMKFTKQPPQPVLSQDEKNEIKLINDEEKQQEENEKEEERKTFHIINPLSSHDLMEQEQEEEIGLEMKEL